MATTIRAIDGGGHVLAIDQGTSGTKTIIVDASGAIVSRATAPLQTFYLDNGWVEQDPLAIYDSVVDAVRGCLDLFDGDVPSVCGISNQRETFVLWDVSGEPLYNAVVWQCKRSIGICDRLRQQGLEGMIRERTGLLIDPYFSGTKVMWLNENVPAVRDAIRAGTAFFGTVDTWLLYKLTGQYLTDHTNASRTLFFNLRTLDWDAELLALFGLSNLRLPVIQPSASSFGTTAAFSRPMTIASMIGDSHAAAVGEGCLDFGQAKATLGTGCSVLMNIGEVFKDADKGMVTTMGYSVEGKRTYAYEGVIVTCGASIEWLKNELGLFADSRDTERMASAVSDNGGVYLIPAFSGMGAPHWDMNRKASITGLTFGSTRNHIVRAALESIAYQIKDVILAMEAGTGVVLRDIAIHGGISANGFVAQFLADTLQKPVINRGIPDMSALGAAYLAGGLIGTRHGGPVIHPGPGQGVAARGYEQWCGHFNSIHTGV